ncbi:MAG: hypothetical protein EOP09_07595, partial [Proteobacteria bacterium]
MKMMNSEMNPRRMSTPFIASTSTFNWLSAQGESAKRVRSYAWENHPLGPVDSWSLTLKQFVNDCLADPAPAVLITNSSKIGFYNDAILPLMIENFWLASETEPTFSLSPERHSIFITGLDQVRETRTGFEQSVVIPQIPVQDHTHESDRRVIQWSPAWDESGTLVGAWARVRSESEFQAENESKIETAPNITIPDLRRAIQIRDEFLSIASHELKTPITSLKLHLQLAKKRLPT